MFENKTPLKVQRGRRFIQLILFILKMKKTKLKTQQSFYNLAKVIQLASRKTGQNTNLLTIILITLKLLNSIISKSSTFCSTPEISVLNLCHFYYTYFPARLYFTPFNTIYPLFTVFSSPCSYTIFHSSYSQHSLKKKAFYKQPQLYHPSVFLPCDWQNPALN